MLVGILDAELQRLLHEILQGLFDGTLLGEIDGTFDVESLRLFGCTFYVL